jgi:hypothetical protein
MQEIPENGADSAHLQGVHTEFIIPLLGSLAQLKHHWSTDWLAGQSGPPESRQAPSAVQCKPAKRPHVIVEYPSSTSASPAPSSSQHHATRRRSPLTSTEHSAYAPLQQRISCFGFVLPHVHIQIHVNMIGPGLVFVHFDLLGLGEVYIHQTVTPIAPCLQRIRNDIWASPLVPRFVAKLALRAVVLQLERDIEIWNQKTFVARPCVVKGDGRIHQFRRWFNQFYNTNQHHTSSNVDKQTDIDW